MNFIPMTYCQLTDLYLTPPQYAKMHDLKAELTKFLELNSYSAKVELEPGEYKSYLSAQSALFSAASRWKMPIQVTAIRGELYLINLNIKPHKEATT